MQIDPRRRGHLPEVPSPTPFLSPDGRFRGWKVRIPGGHTLATPAVIDERVFLGGGFGSYDFYAFDARTGTLDWQYQTTDDGPTAAAVQDGFVVFNTESCELEMLTVAGRPVWKTWLGDPLMSMPAIASGHVFQAFPDSRGDRRHYLACFRLDSGHELWRQPIEGEIITAPVLADGHIHFSTLDGTLYCVRQGDGHLVHKEARNVTSSPVVWEGECFFSQRREVADTSPRSDEVYQTEHLAAWSLDQQTLRAYWATARKADYLDHLKRMRGSPRYAASTHADSAVGFGHSKGDAKILGAMRNLGQGHVHSVWSYQGSKPFIYRSRLYAAHGDTVHCADPRSEQIHWQRTVGASGPDETLLDGVLTPPAGANGKLFFGTITGEVLCLSAETGAMLWSVAIGEPIIFQPAVARGRVFAGTDAGSLICLETGDAGDDGWLMWGADAAHNGRLA
jgi:outer membrane protein assembly factor BamB